MPYIGFASPAYIRPAQYKACISHMNYLVYGRSSQLCFARCKDIVPHNARVHNAEQEPWLRVSPHHHEFHMHQCASHAQLLEKLLEISQLKRVMINHRHSVIVTDIHLMSRTHLGKLKSIVVSYSDRTAFVLTSQSLSCIPQALIYMCCPIRVPMPSESVRSENSDLIIEHVVDVC